MARLASWGLATVIVLGSCAGGGVEAVNVSSASSDATAVPNEATSAAPTAAAETRDASEDAPAAPSAAIEAAPSDADADAPTIAESATAESVEPTAPRAPTTSIPPPQPRPEATPTPELSASMTEFRGSDTAVAIGRAIRNRLVLQFGCAGATIPVGGIPSEPDTFDLWQSNDILPLINAAPSALIGPLQGWLAAQDEADAACNRDRDAWIAATRQALAALQQVETTIGTTPDIAGSIAPVPGEAGDLTATTADMAAMYDRVYSGLNKVSDMQSSDLWFSATHYAHLRGQRDLLAAGAPRPEVLILGDSVSARGVDGATLANELGRPVVNYSQFSAYPEGLAEFLPQVLTAGEPETIVWTVYPHQILTRGCGEQQRIAIDPFRDPIVLQALAFAPVDWLQDTPTVDLLFGRYEGPGSYGGTQLQHKADDLHEPWLGRAGSPFVHVGIDGPRIERQIAGSVGRYENPEPCQVRFDVIAATFSDLTARGHRVVAVVPPTSEQLASLHPDGWSGHDAIVATIRSVADQANAETLDLSRTVPEDLFHDLVHVNAPGREMFTAELVAFLAR